ncbi:MAG: hypothetical protein QGG50_05305 [Methanopyri archaeon]|nr:hypothetical protein [Methanopyri archaeon]
MRRMSEYFTEDLGVYWERTVYCTIGMLAGIHATPLLEAALPTIKGAYVITTGLGYHVGYSTYVLKEQGKKKYNEEVGDSLDKHFFGGSKAKKGKGKKKGSEKKDDDPAGKRAHPSAERKSKKDDYDDKHRHDDDDDDRGYEKDHDHDGKDGYDLGGFLGYATAAAGALSYAVLL